MPKFIIEDAPHYPPYSKMMVYRVRHLDDKAEEWMPVSGIIHANYTDALAELNQIKAAHNL